MQDPNSGQFRTASRPGSQRLPLCHDIQICSPRAQLIYEVSSNPGKALSS